MVSAVGCREVAVGAMAPSRKSVFSALQRDPGPSPLVRNTWAVMATGCRGSGEGGSVVFGKWLWQLDGPLPCPPSNVEVSGAEVRVRVVSPWGSTPQLPTAGLRPCTSSLELWVRCFHLPY